MTTIKIHNIETNEVIERKMNAEELTQFKKDETTAKLQVEAKQNLAALKKSAKAKLIAGEPLTEEEADVLVI
jgi:ribosomal protein S12